MGLLPLFRPVAACFGVCVALVCASSSDAQTPTRLATEARELFKAVDRGVSSRCRFERAWDSRPVVAETAQRYLKLSVHADLVVSEPPATPMATIDPAGREADAFCMQPERDNLRREALAAFRDGDGSVLRFTLVSYGFPIFDRGYTRAALMVQSLGEVHHRMPDGTLKLTRELAGGAEIYARRRGVWKRVDYDSYYTGH